MPVAACCLASPRVRLTPLDPAHIRTHFAWNNDAELHAMESDQPFVPESYGAFARRFAALQHNDPARGYDFEIHRRDATNSLLGVAALWDINATSRHARLTLTIGERSAWGQGYGRAALNTLLRFGFDTLGLHRVRATALAYNACWKHLLTTTGFHQEGRQREHVYRNGRYWDQESYALLAREYQSRHALAA